MDTHDNNTTKEYDFASRLSHKIISEHITPRSKIMTIIIQLLLWVPWLFVTLIGIVGVAGIVFTASYSGWKYHGAIGVPPFLYAMQTVSVVWIMCLVVFGAIVIKAFRITQKGYRVSPFTIIILSLAVSIAGGSLLYIGDKVLMQNNYFRRPIQARQYQLWNNPYNGRMMGMVSRVNEVYVLNDNQGKTWELVVETVRQIEQFEGQAVRVAGMPLSDNTFKVCALFPLQLGVSMDNGNTRNTPTLTEEEKEQLFINAREFECGDMRARKHLYQSERK